MSSIYQAQLILSNTKSKDSGDVQALRLQKKQKQTESNNHPVNFQRFKLFKQKDQNQPDSPNKIQNSIITKQNNNYTVQYLSPQKSSHSKKQRNSQHDQTKLIFSPTNMNQNQQNDNQKPLQKNSYQTLQLQNGNQLKQEFSKLNQKDGNIMHVNNEKIVQIHQFLFKSNFIQEESETNLNASTAYDEFKNQHQFNQISQSGIFKNNQVVLMFEENDEFEQNFELNELKAFWKNKLKEIDPQIIRNKCSSEALLKQIDPLLLNSNSSPLLSYVNKPNERSVFINNLSNQKSSHSKQTSNGNIVMIPSNLILFSPNKNVNNISSKGWQSNNYERKSQEIQGPIQVQSQMINIQNDENDSNKSIKMRKVKYQAQKKHRLYSAQIRRKNIQNRTDIQNLQEESIKGKKLIKDNMTTLQNKKQQIESIRATSTIRQKMSKNRFEYSEHNQNKKQDVFYETLSPSSMNNLVKNASTDKQNFENILKQQKIKQRKTLADGKKGARIIKQSTINYEPSDEDLQREHLERQYLSSYKEYRKQLHQNQINDSGFNNNNSKFEQSNLLINQNNNFEDMPTVKIKQSQFSPQCVFSPQNIQKIKVRPKYFKQYFTPCSGLMQEFNVNKNQKKNK